MSSSGNPKSAVLISLGMVVAGLIVGFVGNWLIGGAIAAAGIIPACYGAWLGMQKETQTDLGLSILMVLVSLGVGGIALVMAIIDWLR